MSAVALLAGGSSSVDVICMPLATGSAAGSDASWADVASPSMANHRTEEAASVPATSFASTENHVAGPR